MLQVPESQARVSRCEFLAESSERASSRHLTHKIQIPLRTLIFVKMAARQQQQQQQQQQQGAPTMVQPSLSLFEAVTNNDFDTIADLYAENARRTIVSFLAMRNRWSPFVGLERSGKVFFCSHLCRKCTSITKGFFFFRTLSRQT